MDERKSKIFDNYKKAGQEHVFKHWESLSAEEKTLLLDQLETIPVEKLADYLHVATNECSSDKEVDIQPFSGTVGKPSSGDGDNNELYNIGMKAIGNNEVAAVLLAGGQGTRLGFDGPKGMYDIGLTSGRTLFQLISQRILKLTQLAEAKSTENRKRPRDENGNGNGEEDGKCQIRIPLYIMTSPMNHATTEQYFKSNDFFGLSSSDVIFFSQGVLPCLSPDGKILLEKRHQCAMAPDGNGGIYPAMDKQGILKDLEKRGVKHVHTFSIDNALVKPADPGFIGYCVKLGADCGNKVLWKSNAHEKVGVIAEKDGKPCVVEYSELSKDMAERVVKSDTTGNGNGDCDGEGTKLAFGAANICNHYYHLDFLQNKVIPNLGNMFHLARKKIGTWDEDKKKTVTPSTNNGIKLESFIFDVFPLSTSMAIYEVERRHEFAPVKNAPGAKADSPDTARAMISAVAKEWLGDAGATLISNEQEKSGDKCEISPLLSYGGEGLEKYKGEEISCPFSL